MNVLFQNRNPLLWNGGDMMKMRNFQKYIREEGVNVEFYYDSSIDASGYDVAHLFNINFPWTYEQAINLKKQNIPFVVSAIYFQGVGNMDQVREVAELADAIIVFSDKETNMMIVDAGLDVSIKKKCRVIQNGVDTMFISSNEDRDIDVLQVGTFHPRKQQHITAEACKRLGLKVTIVGNPHDKHYFTRTMSQYSDVIRFEPNMSHDELKHYYSRAKVVVQPSTFDPYPNTILEAGLAGCWTICTDKTYVEEDYKLPNKMIDPTVENVEIAISEALEDWEIQSERSGFVQSENNWNNQAIKTIKLYEEII